MLRRRQPLKRRSGKRANPRDVGLPEGYVPPILAVPAAETAWAVGLESAAGEVWQALDELIYLHTHNLSAGLQHDQNRIRFQRAVVALIRLIQA